MKGVYMEEEKLLPRRWGILIGMTCVLVAIQFNSILPGGAAVVTIMQYGITPMEFSMIMSASYFTGFLFAIAAGVMADRWGMNKVLLSGFFIALAGSILRIFSIGNFPMIMASMVIMGFGVAVLNANSAKLLRDWFPGRSNSVAMGVYTAGMSLGAAVAIWYGSRLDPATATGSDLQGVWIVGSVLIVIGIIAWIICYRNHPSLKLQTEPIGKYLKEVLRNPAVWGVSIFAFFGFGMTAINGNYMVAAVTTLAGDPSAQIDAGNMSTINTVIAAVASMALPAVFATFCKNLRAPVIICALITGVCFAVVFFLPYGPLTWVCFLIQPLAMASIMPFVKMAPTLLPNVKREDLGAIGGIQATFQNLGMFLIGSYVISPLAIVASGVQDGLPYYQAVYVGIGILCVILCLSLLLFPNVPSSMDRKLALDKEKSA